MTGIFCYALDFYGIFTGQSNNRLGGVFGFGLFRLVCGRLSIVALYIENNRNAAVNFPFASIPFKSYRAGRGSIKLMIYINACIVIINIFF